MLNYARKLVCGDLTGEDMDDSMEDTEEVLWLEFFYVHSYFNYSHSSSHKHYPF